MTSRFIPIGVSVALACTLISGCGIQSADREQPQEQMQAQNRARILQEDTAEVIDSQKKENQVKNMKGGNIKALAGGSEVHSRVLKPMNNYELQRKYPDTVVLRGAMNRNLAALTFDDGPDARFTPQVLDVLKKHQVKATFFLMGSRVKGHPKVTERIMREGHSIGNHTYWHPKLYRESIDRLKWEVLETDKEIRNVVGYTPKLFRAPYGGLNDDIVQAMEQMNFSVVGWSVDSMDWTQADAETVQRNVRSNMHPGAIVLMHSGGHWTQDLSGMVQALDEMIPKLKGEGVQFVTLPELLNLPEKKS